MFQTTNQKIKGWSFIVNPLSLVSPPLDWLLAAARLPLQIIFQKLPTHALAMLGLDILVSVPERSTAEDSERNQKNQPQEAINSITLWELKAPTGNPGNPSTSLLLNHGSLHRWGRSP